MRNILHEIWHIQVHLANLIACIEEIRDPRIERGKKHDLVAIILISILAISSGAKNWVEIVEFAYDHESWLRSQIWLPNGIPSHDTFTRVFIHLDANEFKGWLLLWLEVALESRGDHIAFDGKIIKCWTADNPFTLVSAFCTSAKIVLEQARVPNGKNEVAALDRVLNALNLKGKVVTIDAIGTNKLLVKKIVKKGGDYVLPVKRNHPLLYEDITLFMNTLANGGHEEIEYDYYETHDHAHGRKEIRRCFSTNYIAWLPQRKEWPNLKSITLVELEVDGKGRHENGRRIFISSLPADAKRILGYVRSHWSIENNHHRNLDINFDEDRRTLRKGHGPQNFSFLCALVNSVLSRETSGLSLLRKLRRGNSNPDFILNTLMNPGI